MSTTATKSRPRKSPAVRPGNRALKPGGSGLVHYFVHDPPKPSAPGDLNPAHLIKVVENGLPVKELTDLQASLDVPAEKLAPMLRISKATFHRRKGAGERLGPAESDRVVRFARLLGRAIRVFGDRQEARQWLNSPQFGLGGAVPLNYARTEVGAREVENLLGRIEFGVYS